MRAILQRVLKANINIDGSLFSSIEKGVVVLLGINKTDNEKDFKYMIEKIINIRIFEDENEKMNLSLKDLNLQLMIIPNFTIYGDVRHGRRPSFTEGATVLEAEKIFNNFIDYAKQNYGKIEIGKFKADMKVELINDGPVTILLDSEKLF